jgi:hypothetical protein
VTNALVQRFSNGRIRAAPTAFGATETMHMLCHVTLERRDFDPRASELGRLRFQGLGGPRSVQLGVEPGMLDRTAPIEPGMTWLILAAVARTELVRVKRCSRTRGSAPGRCTQRHGSVDESELIELNEFVRAVRLGDAPGAEDGPGNPDFRVPGQFRRCDGRLGAGYVPR